MLTPRRQLLIVALAVLPLVACGQGVRTELFVEIQCDREMFVTAIDVTDLESWQFPAVDLDEANFAEPNVEESVGLFDLSTREIEVYVLTTTRPIRSTGPFPVTEADLVLKHEFDEGPPSVLVIPAESCPSPDDPPR